MRVFLSIDYDFFLWRGDRTPEQRVVVWPGTPREEKIHALHLFDWQHSEHHSPFLQGVMWLSRASAFYRAGLDPVEIMKPTPTPELFVQTLVNALRSQGTGYMSDSHGWGYSLMKAVGANRRNKYDLLHFDAHHDLGYGEVDRERVTCASWAAHAIRRGWVRSMTIVYPDWQTPNLEPVRDLTKPQQKLLRFCSWSEWAREPELKDPIVDTIHLARSGAWSPPWLDPGFLALAEQLKLLTGGHAFGCLDCLQRHGGRDTGADPCVARTWGPEEIAQAQAMAGLQLPHPGDERS